MAIIDKQVYKLNNHDIKVSDALFRCAEGEKHCKAMVKKLVFYDRDEIMKLYSDYISRKGEYDVSKLQQISFLDNNEEIERVLPLDYHWLGILVKNRTTKKPNSNKILYVSMEGDGYLTDDIQSALNGCVPDYVYFKHLEDNPTSFISLDKKYFDGSHNEFLDKYFRTAKAVITGFFVPILKQLDPSVKQDISLEEINELIRAEYRKNPKSEHFETYKAMDFMYSQLGCDKIIELSNRYNLTEDINKINQEEKQ